MTNGEFDIVDSSTISLFESPIRCIDDGDYETVPAEAVIADAIDESEPEEIDIDSL